jgi:uncharacterized protein
LDLRICLRTWCVLALVLAVRASGSIVVARPQDSSSLRDAAKHLDATPDEVRRLRLAADRGDAIAQNDLGLLYSRGSGVPRDVAQAFELFQLAARQGLAKAEFNEGNSYASGAGVSMDLAEAFQWYAKAAAQGLPAAEFAVGSAYAEGNGVWVDDVRAFEWYVKAAQQGHALAQLAVGEAYASGRGVQQSDERSFPWLRQAADQGVARAEYLYGMKHPLGPISEDVAVAVKWFRKAADQDYAPAQFMLGTLYLKAVNDSDSVLVPDETKGIVKDFVEADHWFIICWKRASGEIGARCGAAVEEAEKGMSGEETSEAQNRALEWMRTYDARLQ